MHGFGAHRSTRLSLPAGLSVVHGADGALAQLGMRKPITRTIRARIKRELKYSCVTIAFSNHETFP